MIYSFFFESSTFFFLIVETQADDDNDEEYYRARLLDDHSASNSETDEIPIASTSTHETNIEHTANLSQETDHEDEEQQARQLLLEQSDASEHEEDNGDFLRPCIRLKRISPTDAQRYMPPAWKNRPQSSDTSSLSSSSDDEEDFNIKYRTRKSPSKKTDKSFTQCPSPKTFSRKKSKDIFINYNIPPAVDEASLEDSLTIAEVIGPIDDEGTLQELIDNNDNECIFDSLVTPQDKPMETIPTEVVTPEIPNEPVEELSTGGDSTDDR